MTQAGDKWYSGGPLQCSFCEIRLFISLSPWHKSNYPVYESQDALRHSRATHSATILSNFTHNHGILCWGGGVLCLGSLHTMTQSNLQIVQQDLKNKSFAKEEVNARKSVSFSFFQKFLQDYIPTNRENNAVRTLELFSNSRMFHFQRRWCKERQNHDCSAIRHKIFWKPKQHRMQCHDWDLFHHCLRQG